MLTGKWGVRVLIAATVAMVATIVPAMRALTDATSNAAGGSSVYGLVLAQGGGTVKVRVELFTADWRYLRAINSTTGGVYKIQGLAPGTYHLQASDRREVWDIGRRARTDATFTVAAGRSVERDVIMRRGSYVTGKVKVGSGAPGRRATVRVVSQYGATFETVANGRGEFAIGGLPAKQKYSVFTWDRSKVWTGKSVYVGSLKAGKGRDIRVRLRVRGGSYVGFLKVNGLPATGRFWATVVNRTTGQWWTAPITQGDMAGFRGLYPGRYTLQLSAGTKVVAQQIALPLVRAGRRTIVRVNAKPAPPAPVKPTTSAKPTGTATATGTPTSTATASSTATSTATATGTATASATASSSGPAQ